MGASSGPWKAREGRSWDGLAWNWRLHPCLAGARPASDGSLGARWALASGLLRSRWGSSLHAAQPHPGCRWQRSLEQGLCGGRSMSTAQASAKTNWCSSDVIAKTRLSSRAQPIRFGRAWTGSTSHPAVTAAPVTDFSCAGGSCGTSSGRSSVLALGSSVASFGTHPKTRDIFGVIATTPRGDFLVVECTRGLPRTDE